MYKHYSEEVDHANLMTFTNYLVFLFFFFDLVLRMVCFCSTFPTMGQNYVTKLSDENNKLGHKQFNNYLP